jgi:methionine-gamma-lyase
MGSYHNTVGIPRPIIPAIYPNAGTHYNSLDEYFLAIGDAAVGGQSLGYPPLGNPINTMLETKLALLEKAEKAVLVSNGMAAIATAILAFVHYGEQVLAPLNLHGVIEILLSEYLPNFGIRANRIGFGDLEALKRCVTPQTKVIFLEIPATPFLEIFDIRACAEIAHRTGAILIVDHSLASPALIQPIKLGADMVVGSMTTYLGGGNDAPLGYIAGAREHILEAANYAWVLGHSMNHRSATVVLHNLSTFSLRMTRHCQNAWAVANFLASHRKVSKVLYPGLSSHPDHQLAKREMSLFGGTISFWLKGDMQGTIRFLNSLRVCYLGYQLGDPTTSIEHPSSMTYLGVSQKKKAEMGIESNFLRISVGLEDVDPVLRDLDQALRNV